MAEQIFRDPDIYKINVPLPDNPLKNINSYVIKTPEKNLIIDTGFNMEECRQALNEGLNELGINMKKTALFLTHFHSDHAGLAFALMPEKSEIYMSSKDCRYFYRVISKMYVSDTEERFLKEGFTKDDVYHFKHNNPIICYAPDKLRKIITVEEGDVINIGAYGFKCIETPGHTPGHMCLYLESRQILFSGDHVLFHITPNISFWTGIKDSLGDYMASLMKVSKLDVRTVFPAHRQVEGGFYDRINEILVHHQERLQEILLILGRKRFQFPMEIASQMGWSMKGKKWEEAPINQRWFATAEVVSHLDRLCRLGAVLRVETGGFYKYSLK